MAQPVIETESKVQVLSPKWLCALMDSWGELIARVLEWCLDSYIGRSIVVFILTVSAFVFAGIFEDQRSRFPDFWLLHNSIYDAIFPVALLFFFTTLIPALRTILFQPYFRVIATLICLWLLLPVPNDIKVLSKTGLQFALILLFAWITLSATQRLGDKTRVSIHILICTAAFFLPSLWSEWDTPEFVQFVPFPTIHALAFSSVFLMHEVARLSPTVPILNRLSHVLSPLHLVTPIPLAVASLPEVHKKSFDLKDLSQSVLSFCQGIAALGVVALLLNHIDLGRAHGGLIRGWQVYLIYLFFWLGVIRVGYAAALQLGYRLPPPTDFALLAVDPLSRWRRWNRYYYDWFLTYVFLPVSRLATSKRYLMAATGILAVFVLNFFLHNNFLLNLLLFRPDLASVSEWNIAGTETSFYTLHVLTVFIGVIGRKYWPADNRLSGWWGVIVTHVLMAATHSVIMR